MDAENYSSVFGGYVVYGYRVLPHVGFCDREACEDFIPVRLDLHGAGVSCDLRGRGGGVSGHACCEWAHGWCGL